MFKKFVSMATATLVIGGLSAVAAPSASATSSDATLSQASVKGVTAVLGTPNGSIGSVVAGSVTISSDEAASSSATTATMTTPGGQGSVAIRKFAAGSTPTALQVFQGSTFSTGTLTNGDLLFFMVTSSDLMNIYFYKIVVTVGSSQQNNSSSSSSSSDAAVAAAAALAQKVATAKATLVDSIKSGKPLTAADLNAAELTVASAKAAERVNAKIQTLPEAQRSDLAKIKVIVERENFVEKVSSTATQFQVNTRDLVRVGLVAPDYVYKGAVVRSLLSADPVVLATIEQVEKAVKDAQAAVQARKDRLTAIIAKINGIK